MRTVSIFYTEKNSTSMDRGNLVNDRGKLHLNTAVLWSFLDILSCTEVAF